MQSLYGHVLKESWQIIWRHKYLWFLGILAILFAGSIEIELLDSLFEGGANSYINLRAFLSGGLFDSSLLSSLQGIFSNDAQTNVSIISFLLFFALTLVAIIGVSVFSQIIIIDHTAQIKRSKGQLRPSIKDSFVKQWRRLIAVAGLNLAVKVFVYIAFVVISIPIVLSLAQASSLSNSIYLLLFVILLSLSIIFSFVVKYMISYIVVYKQSYRLAMKNGWRLFVENWLVSIEMSFVLFLIHILGSLVVLFAITVVSIPLWFLTALGSGVLGPWFFVGMLVISFIILFVCFVLGGGLIISYIITAWTTLFIKLNEEGGASKIARTVTKLTK